MGSLGIVDHSHFPSDSSISYEHCQYYGDCATYGVHWDELSDSPILCSGRQGSTLKRLVASSRFKILGRYKTYSLGARKRGLVHVLLITTPFKIF